MSQLHFVFWAIPSLIQGKVSMDRVDGQHNLLVPANTITHC